MQVVTTLPRTIANVIKILILTKIENGQMKNLNLEELKTSDLKEINGGGLIGIAIGVAALVIACATALGYYDGKKDCMPPPCTE